MPRTTKVFEMSSRGRPPGLAFQIVGLIVLAGIVSVAPAIVQAVRPDPGSAPAEGPIPVLAFQGAALVLLIVLSLAVSRRLARYLRAIPDRVESIARGEIPAPLPPTPAAEAEGLAHALALLGTPPGSGSEGGTGRGDAPVPAEQVGRLSGALADELAGPLGRLRGLAGADDTSRASGQVMPDPLRLSLLVEVARLEATVRRLRALAGDVTPRPVSVPLNAAVGACVEALRPLALASACAVTFDPDPNLGRLRLDPDILHRILVPVLRRALHVSPGGRVDVRTQALPGEALVAVRDEGPLVDQEALASLFDPLEAPGDGEPALDLPASARLARAHGGTITAVNLQPKGLELCLRIPARPASPAAPGTGG